MGKNCSKLSKLDMSQQAEPTGSSAQGEEQQAMETDPPGTTKVTLKTHTLTFRRGL